MLKKLTPLKIGNKKDDVWSINFVIHRNSCLSKENQANILENEKEKLKKSYKFKIGLNKVIFMPGQKKNHRKVTK